MGHPGLLIQDYVAGIPIWYIPNTHHLDGLQKSTTHSPWLDLSHRCAALIEEDLARFIVETKSLSWSFAGKWVPHPPITAREHWEKELPWHDANHHLGGVQ
jgi:hypothetical protein